jgi:diacylglycerol kinase family enzyme
MTTKRYLLVANPTAQSGKARGKIDKVMARMAERGMEVDFLATLPDGQTVAALRHAIDNGKADTVVTMGGDGTFAEVGKGVLGATRPVQMAMLPSGTANDQGKSFGVRAGLAALETNLDTMEAGHIVYLDVGQVECVDGAATHTDFFFDSAGWGLQPDILAIRNRDRDLVGEIPILRELYRDMAVYTGAFFNRYLNSLVEPVKFDAEIVVDGKSRHYQGLTDVIINGTPVYGGAWVLDRHSQPDDGIFEIIPIQGRRDWFSKVFRDLAQVPVWQEHLDLLGVAHAEGTAGSKFEINLFRPAGNPVRSQIDGEEWLSGDSFRVSVLKHAIPLLVPAGFAPPWKHTIF